MYGETVAWMVSDSMRHFNDSDGMMIYVINGTELSVGFFGLTLAPGKYGLIPFKVKSDAYLLKVAILQFDWLSNERIRLRVHNLFYTYIRIINI